MLVIRKAGGGMKQALRVVLRVGGKEIKHVPLVALIVDDRGMKETLPPVPRVAYRWGRLLSCLLL